MNIKSLDAEISQLLKKGYSDKFPSIENETIEDIHFAFTDLACASCIEDIQAPPYYAEQTENGSFLLFLKNEWLLNVNLTLTEAENEIEILSLQRKEVFYGRPA